MAFWNRKKPHRDGTAQAVVRLRAVVESLQHRVNTLYGDVDRLSALQSVPTNSKSQTGSAVQDWLPVVDRMQELLLVQMGNADLAQAFGTYARQRELRDADKPEITWTEPTESSYENV